MPDSTAGKPPMDYIGWTKPVTAVDEHRCLVTDDQGQQCRKGKAMPHHHAFDGEQPSPVVDTDLWERFVRAIASQQAVIPDEDDGFEWERIRGDANAVMTEVAPVLAERDERIATLQAEIDRLRKQVDFHLKIRMGVEEVLNEVIGTEVEDGAGEGHVSDVNLLAQRYKDALADVGRLRASLKYKNINRLRDQLDALKGNARLVWLPEFGDDEEIPLGEPVVHNHADGRFVLRTTSGVGSQPDSEPGDRDEALREALREDAEVDRLERESLDADEQPVSPATPTEPRRMYDPTYEGYEGDIAGDWVYRSPYWLPVDDQPEVAVDQPGGDHQ